MNRKRELLQEILEKGFKCVDGPLSRMAQFKELKELIEAEDNAFVPAPLPDLKNPLCFLDLETTGTDPEKDRIIEISILKYTTENSAIGSIERKTVRINPGISIPQDATDVHGITDEMVKDCPLFQQLAKGIHLFIDGCDIAGYNSNRFDVPFLFFSLDRAGVRWDWKKVNLIDVCNIFKIKEERNLSAAVKFYCNRDHGEAHTAEADVIATRDAFLVQLNRYSDLPKDFKELALFSNYGRAIVDMAGKFTRNDQGDIIFNFGKNMGKKATSDKEYLFWMTTKGDFNSDTKAVAQDILHS